jgi:hypothetical protein
MNAIKMSEERRRNHWKEKRKEERRGEERKGEVEMR